MQNTAARKLKQVPEGYLIVGIDPHKKKHAAVAITQDLTIHDRFKLDNTREGLEFLVHRVQDGNGEIRLQRRHVRDRDGRSLLAKCGVLPG